MQVNSVKNAGLVVTVLETGLEPLEHPGETRLRLEAVKILEDLFVRFK